MNHLQQIKRFIFSVALLGTTTLSSQSFAQSEEVTNDGVYWLAADLRKRVFKGFRVALVPEIRSLGWKPTRYMATVSARYKPIDYFAMKVGYRSAIINNEGADLRHRRRVAFDLNGILPMGRFKLGARLRYTGAFESDKDYKSRLRYKGKLGWAPKGTPLSFTGFGEAFHDLEAGVISRMRYGLSGEYQFYKKGKKRKRVTQAVSLGYHLDYFLNAYRNVHAAELGYKLAF